MADDDLDDLADSGSSPLGRRALIGGAAAVAAGGAAWFALDRAHRRRGADDQAKAAELVFAFDGAAITKFVLDPHNSGFAPHSRIIRSIYDNLVVLLPDGSLSPWLAQAWELSPDQKSYVFHLRPGVTFHDGTPLNAAAVKANFDRLADPANALTSQSSIGPYAGSEVIDSSRVKVNLSEPFAPLLRNLSMTKLAIVSPTAVAKSGKLFAQNPVGTGPFRFAGLTQGSEIRLVRNPDYRWAPPTAVHQGPAYLERLTFRNVPEEATRVAVLQSGQVHGADLVPPQNVAAFQRDANFRLLQKELLETNYALALNVAKTPWNDEDIRKAVRLSLDIDDIVKVIYLGTLQRAWSPLSPSMFASSEKTLRGVWAPDPARAAAIFEAKGWKPGPDGIRVKDGRRLAISFIDTQGNREKRLDVIQLVRRQLNQAGVDLSIDSEPAGAYTTKIANNQFDMTGGASFHADPDVLRATYLPEVRAVTSGNKVDDPDLIAWLKAAAQEGDPAKRIALYAKVQHKIIDKAYSIPIYVLFYNLVVARGVSGVSIDGHGFPEFHSAKLDS
jgi:peptide/nickel transport system substrate-binding protein